MKINLFRLSLVFVFILFFAMAGQAKADTATTTIRLQIETNDASLYDADIDVTACADSQSASTTSINALCALEQSGVANDWSWYGDLVFLNSIGSYVNNGDSNGIYWGWFENLNYSDLALNQYKLKPGDKILLTYNINPLKISVDNATPYVNATSTITLEQFGLDSNWNPVWSPAASSTLVIAGQDVNNDSGNYIFTSTTTVPVLIYGKKSGYINSDDITITAQEAPPDDNDDNNDQPNSSIIITPTASGGGGGATVVISQLKVDLGKAIDFLISKQSAAGSFGAALQTDWAAIALASANPNGAAGQKTKSYLLTDPNPLIGMNPVSDYARRAMALMSLNINPYDGTKTNYIKKIIGLYDGRQFGDASLYNDDIFALLVLSKAGYAADDEIIKQDVNFIIGKQQVDGSWAGSDLTAAAVQALEPLSSSAGVASALTKAKNFLANAQGADGGYGNVYTTPWVMQAIAALGESSGAWLKNNNTPESSLALSQGADGGMEKDNAYDANRVWSTSYAIPAVQGKPWFNIMNSFVKVENQSAATANLNVSDNPAATSTLEKLDIATSSPETLITASSTESLLQVIEEKIVSSSAAQLDRVAAEASGIISAPARDFAAVGTLSTAKLGAGERAGVLNSYESSFGKSPQTQAEWEDIIRISNNQLPLTANPAAEKKARMEFKKVYQREADIKNSNEQTAINLIAYGLRPDRRDLNSERAGIRIFVGIYKYLPVSALDWDTIRAIAYSGIDM